jgi:hypothetical protein
MSQEGIIAHRYAQFGHQALCWASARRIGEQFHQLDNAIGATGAGPSNCALQARDECLPPAVRVLAPPSI